MALGDLASVKVHLYSSSTIMECALGMQCISPFVNWRALLAAEFLSQIMPDWMAGLSLQTGLYEIRVSDVVPGTGADAVAGTPGVLLGGGGTLPPLYQAACVISWRSDGIGRNTRGRNYLFGMASDEVGAGNTWSSFIQDWATTLGEVIMAQYGPTGFSDLARLQVISRGPHASPLPVPQAFPITHFDVVENIKTMRKRDRF